MPDPGHLHFTRFPDPPEILFPDELLNFTQISKISKCKLGNLKLDSNLDFATFVPFWVMIDHSV